MLPNWAKLAAAFALCVTLVAAPCKNCQPKEQKQDHCGHDCCPKPKPASQPCSWQPADFDALLKGADQGKDSAVTPPLLAAAPTALPATLTLTLAHQDPRPALDPSPPPGSPSISVLRI